MTDKKLTDEEIKKALECCPVADDCYECECKEFCPQYMGDLIPLALDLIVRQQTEIEQLKFEIAKLLPEGCPYATQVEVSNKLEAQIKSEAIKEFAERLKEQKKTSTLDSRIYTTEMINSLVKEMVCE